MINPEQFDRILYVFPILQRVEAQAFQQSTFLASIPAGKDVFVEGDRASALALVLSGVVRVYKTGRMGREITLYRFGPGESCILTANAILNRQPFPANATVEQKTEAVMIPDHALQDWVGRYDVWREFIFGLYSVRLIRVLSIVEDVVFRRMDTRVASFLQQRSLARNPIHMTHQEIATELGSSREVISRILEGFAAQGWIRSARGVVEILDFDSLNTLSTT